MTYVALQANILISSSGTPLVADFGLSCLLTPSSTVDPTSSGLKGSIRWMSVELLHACDQGTVPLHTKESDVWAYGMLIYVCVGNLNLLFVFFQLLTGNTHEDDTFLTPAERYPCYECYNTGSNS